MEHERTGAEGRRLSRDRILDAALAMVDEEGLEGSSMRHLGRRLGVEAMSIYHHVPSKAELLDGLVERLALSIDLPAAHGDDWQAVLRDVGRAYRRVAHAHPKSFPLLATRPLATPAAIARTEPLHEALARAGFGPRERVVALQTLFTFLNGYLLAEVGTVPGHAGEPEPDVLAAYAAVPRNEAPLVREAGDLIGPATSLAAQFEASLDIVIEGCGRLLDGSVRLRPGSSAEPAKRKPGGLS